MINTGATTNLVEANLVPNLGLQVAKANIAVDLTSHHPGVPNGIAVANLSVGTWVHGTTFVVMAISKFDVILGMEFLYNAEVHVLSHLSCIWIEGMGEPCTVECEYLSSIKLESSLQITHNGLDRGSYVIMSMVEEHDQVEEGLEGYTKISKEFMVGETLEPRLDKSSDGDKNQGEKESKVESPANNFNYRKANDSKNVRDFQEGTDCGESLLYRGKRGCIDDEVRSFEHSKTTSEDLVKVLQWVVWFILVLLGVTTYFPIIGALVGGMTIKHWAKKCRKAS
ncbi:hypothetical protein WN943_014966 [Citrus x changshan-huyou]